MLNYLKKVWPIIVIILFVAVYGLLFGLEFDLIANGEITAGSDWIFIPAIIIILSFLACWIYFMVHAGMDKKNKYNVLWVAILYCFNVFVMPYYYYKYIVKADNILEKMIMMLIMYVVSFGIGLVIYSYI